MYRITPCLSVGPYLSADRIPALLAANVTHVLNVSNSHSATETLNAGFREVHDVPMLVDGRLPEVDVLHALDQLFRMTGEPLAHVYVHCVYGQQRSPTVLWLFLIACGVDAEAARLMIETRAMTATAGHPRLVGPEMVTVVRRHGAANKFHLVNENVITPYLG